MKNKLLTTVVTVFISMMGHLYYFTFNDVAYTYPQQVGICFIIVFHIVASVFILLLHAKANK